MPNRGGFLGVLWGWLEVRGVYSLFHFDIPLACSSPSPCILIGAVVGAIGGAAIAVGGEDMYFFGDIIARIKLSTILAFSLSCSQGPCKVFLK